MGRNRERIVDKRMAMMIEADNGQNKSLFPRTSFAYVFPRNASAPFTISLTNQSVFTLTNCGNSTFLTTFNMALKLPPVLSGLSVL